MLWCIRGWVLSCCLAIGCPAIAKPKLNFDQLMSQSLESRISALQSLENPELKPRYFSAALVQFYQQRHYQPVWTEKSLDQLIRNIDALKSDGLNPRDYLLSQLKIALPIVAMRNNDAVALRVDDELRATGVYLTSLFHLYFGKVDADGVRAQWQIDLSQLTAALGSELLTAAETAQIDNIFQKARPDHSFYQSLVENLKYYQRLADAGGWPALADGPTLKPCVVDPQIAVLRHRLRITGEYTDLVSAQNPGSDPVAECLAVYPASSSSSSIASAHSSAASVDETTRNETTSSAASVRSSSSEVSSSSASSSLNPDELFDVRLVEAVKQFQRDQYLEVDAAVGLSTRTALNISVQSRIDQIRVNLDRARSLLRKIPADLVLVDVAGFKLTYFRSSKPVWESRVQVGMAYRTTPIFRSDIHYLTLNPGWTVPPTILQKDVLPKVREDINYLRKNNIRVFNQQGKEVDAASIDWSAPGSITLRQDAGADAALGKAVIRFPNPYSVYLHDTPHKRLFKRSQRAFSSGCIRVENIMELVELLLQEKNQMDKASVEAILKTGKTHNLGLKEKVPVMLAYWTVELKDNTRLVFKPDIYLRDLPALLALNH